MKLYHHPMSSNARKAVITAKVLGSPVQLQLVDLQKGEQRGPEFLKLNPNGAVPVLDDEGFVLTESNAIMIYLCEKAGAAGAALYPTGLRERSTVNRWLFWMSNHWSPAIAGLNFENMLKKMFGQGDPDPAQVARHETFLKKFAAVLDGELGTRTWVCGDSMTLADISIATPLMYMQAAKLPLADFAHVNRWFEKVTALPAWKDTDPFK